MYTIMKTWYGKTVLSITKKAQTTKEKSDMSNYLKILNFYISKT